MPQQLVNPAKVTETFVHLNESQNNRALYSAVVNGRDITEEVPNLSLAPGYRLVRIDNRTPDKIKNEHFELALVNDVTEEIAYYNRVIFQPDTFLKCRPVTQILVWRTQKPKHRKILHTLAGIIFLEYLLEKYDVIVSDQNQTHEGMSFWQARMYDALERGLHLYAYDVIECKLIPLTNEYELEKGETWLWGEPEHFQERLAIISKFSLPA